MQHKTLCAIFFIACLSAHFNLFAQEKNKEEKSYFKLSGSYLTNSVYNGRKDSARLPYITPGITYYDKSGFSVGTAVSYLSSTNARRIDLVSIDVSYDFKIAKQFSGSVYASKYFYNSGSTNVQGNTKALIGASVGYENDFVSLSGDMGILLSQKSDFFFTPSAYHDFSFGSDDNEWNITPTIAANIGTLNYYKQYFANINKRRAVVGAPIIQVNNADGVLLLNYELSLPITYDGKKWGLFVTPTYAIPQSPIQVTLPGGSVFKEEKLENSFYGEFGVYVKF